MTDRTSLGDRMKGYENVTKVNLIKRMPVVVRLDGKAFHTYTKDCDSPYDTDLHYIRENTLEYLCNNIQGCILGYSQSDEISLVLKDWDTLNTSAWYDNKLQKICSVTASMCTARWNSQTQTELSLKFKKDALFDSRVWNLPREEVVNYLLWRQRDWERNSVQMLGQSLYSHSSLQGVSNSNLVSKIEEEYGVIWGNLDSWVKRGEFWFDGEIVDTPRFNEFRRDIEEVLI